MEAAYCGVHAPHSFASILLIDREHLTADDPLHISIIGILLNCICDKSHSGRNFLMFEQKNLLDPSRASRFCIKSDAMLPINRILRKKHIKLDVISWELIHLAEQWGILLKN